MNFAGTSVPLRAAELKFFQYRDANGNSSYDAFGRATGAVAASRTLHDTRALPEVYDPGNPMAGPDGYYLGSNVDLVVEVADAREAGKGPRVNVLQVNLSLDANRP